MNGVKPIRTDVDIRADLAELTRWVNSRDEDPSMLLFALATDVEPLLLRAAQAEARLANAETALNELGDVRRYGERNSPYYNGAQTMAKRVRAALGGQ